MRSLFVAFMFACVAVVAQNGACIEFKITSSKGPTGTLKINYSEFGHISDLSMLVPQLPGGGVRNKTLVTKTSPDIIYTIMDWSKSYSEQKKSDATGNDKNTYSVKKIGEETVNGYKCIHAKLTQGAETEDVWTSKDIKDYTKYAEAFNTNSLRGSAKRDKALKDAGCDGFPVKVVHKGNEKEGTMILELVKVEKKTFSQSDFEIPAGYSKKESKSAAPGGADVKTQEELMNMTPEERTKYIEEMKKKYGAKKK